MQGMEEQCRSNSNACAESARGSVVHLYQLLKKRVQEQIASGHKHARASHCLRSPALRQVERGGGEEFHNGTTHHQHADEFEQPTQGFMSVASRFPTESVAVATPSDAAAGQQQAEASLTDFYSIDWTPKEFLVKFRQQLYGYQLGANFEIQQLEKAAGKSDGTSSPHKLSMFGYQVDDGGQAQGWNTKLVLKPLGEERMWKVICEPKQHDVRFMTKKIPIGPLFNLQLGVGHDYENNVTGWQWKLTTSLGCSTVSHIHKQLFPICPGIDFRLVWNAEYSFPTVHGGLGAGEPEFGLDIGHLYASMEKLEAIFTRCS